jgi:hypothetical protein
MSTISDKTDELFMVATLSDDDLGSPNGVEFVPGDEEEWADDAVWRKLAEGRPTVVVGEQDEVLLVPMRRSLVDKLRGRVTVNIGHGSTVRCLPTSRQAVSGDTRCARCLSAPARRSAGHRRPDFAVSYRAVVTLDNRLAD